MPGMPGGTDFLGLLRYFLVNYYLAFDSSFDRIKACGYDKCRKLFFEKKSGSAEFCSKICRRARYKENDETFNCRERQKAWIRSKINNKQIRHLFYEKYEFFPTAYYMYKHECASCISQAKGDSCPISLEKNEKMIRIYNRLSKLPKSFNN